MGGGAIEESAQPVCGIDSNGAVFELCDVMSAGGTGQSSYRRQWGRDVRGLTINPGILIDDYFRHQ